MFLYDRNNIIRNNIIRNNIIRNNIIKKSRRQRLFFAVGTNIHLADDSDREYNINWGVANAKKKTVFAFAIQSEVKLLIGGICCIR